MASTPDSPSERSASGGGWVGRIVSAVVGIIVTVAGALIIGQFQARDPHLVYSSTESLPFSGPSGEVSIYQITISNDGKREVYDVACVAQIPGGRVDRYKITANPLLGVSGSASGDTVNIQIPNLNPSESVQISLLATASSTLPVHPDVLVRGRGVVGAQKSLPEEAQLPFGAPLISLFAATFALLVAGVFMRLLSQNKKLIAFAAGSSGGSGYDQRQALAYICRAGGLRDLAEQYSAQTHETTYWAEADRLGDLATDQTGGERMAAIERILLTMIDYPGMARSSKGIVYYNLALISHAKKDEAACRGYLDLARKTSPAEIEFRLKVDKRLGS